MAQQLSDNARFDYLVMRARMYWYDMNSAISRGWVKTDTEYRYIKGMENAFYSRAAEMVLEHISISELMHQS